MFSNSTVSLLVLLLFFGNILLMSCDFVDIYGVMPRPKRKEKLVKVWLRKSVCSVWKSKKDLAGYGNNTNSDFAEFLLHRESFATSPHNGNSNKRRRKEISLKLDDISPVASKYCFPSVFTNVAF